jgi:hypothetical protein
MVRTLSEGHQEDAIVIGSGLAAAISVRRQHEEFAGRYLVHIAKAAVLVREELLLERHHPSVRTEDHAMQVLPAQRREEQRATERPGARRERGA